MSKIIDVNFITPLQIEPYKGSLIMLSKPLIAEIKAEDFKEQEIILQVSADKGFVFNGRSGPQILDAAFPQLPYLRCWALHDALYDCSGRDTDGVQVLTRRECDDVLVAALEADGMGRISADLVDAGLFLGGWAAWEDPPSGLCRVSI